MALRNSLFVVRRLAINITNGNLHLFHSKTLNIASLFDLAPDVADIQVGNGIFHYLKDEEFKVGGQISSQIIEHMNLHGRIAVCGAISGNNDGERSKASSVQYDMVCKALKMEGFLIGEHESRFLDIIKIMAQWLREGKIKSRSTVTNGLENTFKAFSNMLHGGAFGKAIIQL